MRIKVTLRRSEGRSTNLTVTADATAAVGDLAAEIFAGDPENRGRPVPERLTLRIEDSTGRGSAGARILEPSSDLLSAGVLSGSTVSLVRLSDAFADQAEGRGPAAATLRVLSGPDAGREFPLPVGTSYVGRDLDMDVRLTDPMVSKRHAKVLVGNGVEVVDTNSANGIEIGGTRVVRAALTSSDTVIIGDSSFVVIPLRRASEAAAAVSAISFNRSPRVVPEFSECTLTGPDPSSKPKARKFPLIAMVAPLFMGAALYAFTRNPLSLVFVALSPIIMMGTWLDSRLTSRREHRESQARFLAALETTRRDITAAHDRERSVLLAARPSTAEAVGSALTLGPLLWSRRPEHPEFLTLRMGTGPVPSRCTLELPSRASADPAEWDALMELEERLRTIPDAPLVGSFRSAGSIGIAGRREAASAAARAAAVQLAALHSPAELSLAVIASSTSRTEWQWIQWLPHVGSAHAPIQGDLLADDAGSAVVLISRIEEVIARRRARSTGGGGSQSAAPRGRERRNDEPDQPAVPALVVIVEDDSPVDRARLVRIAELGPDVSVHVLWVGSTLVDLPGACRTFLLVSDGDRPGSAGFVRTGEHVHPVTTEALSVEDAEAVARALAPVEDAGAPVEDDAGLPRSVSFLSLVGRELGDSAELQVERWRESGSIVGRGGSGTSRARKGNLRAVVGQAGTEPMVLDLRTQGPHALVGGTTGSGKSEFLQAWILGMATAHSPDRVTFLLVDYKGGAAFAECRKLPHTVGLVTDLTPHLVRRALASLRAELKHRERLLEREKAKDLAELESRGGVDVPPSLVIVVDEFAALATEVPEFVDGVVDVAQRGRSLGLHLILATQRPAGVIKPNLRANTNLRVALRMADEEDSADVLGDPLAARFDPMLPGRGAVRTGPGRIALFQSGYAGGVTTTEGARPAIEVVEADFGSLRRWEPPRDAAVREPVAPASSTDIHRVVVTITSAAERAEISPPRQPWRPELATTYELARLGQRTDEELVLGVVDDPANQEQRPVHFLPDSEGHIAIYGASGTGKSAALRSLACAATRTPRGGPVHVYGMDFGGGGLSAVEVLPNVGSMIAGDDSERISRLLLWLRDVVDSRKAAYAGSTLPQYRAASGRQDEPRILVLLDGFGNFRQEYETAPGRSALFTVFQQLLADGRSVGVHFAITADRPGAVPTSVAAGIQRRLVLRQSDENAYMVLDVPRDVLSLTSPPGRAVDAATRLEVQLAVPGGSSNLAEQARAISALLATVPATSRPPHRIGRLPELIPVTDMPTDVGGLPALGVADDTLAPVGFEPTGTFLVSGPPASGRTTAVHAIVRALRRWRPELAIHHVTGRTSPLQGLPVWTRSARSIEDVTSLIREVQPQLAAAPTGAGETVTLVIEGISDFLGTPAEALLTEAIKQAKRNGHFILAEADSASWGSTWPLIAEIRAGRRGLSLQPDQAEGDLLFRTSFPRATRVEFPQGRGYFVQSGRVRKVQTPLPE